MEIERINFKGRGIMLASEGSGLSEKIGQLKMKAEVQKIFDLIKKEENKKEFVKTKKRK